VVLLDSLGHLPEYEARLPLFHRSRFAKISVGRSDDEIARILRRLAPQVITGDPDSLACLARIELPPRRRPSLVLSSSFALPDALARAIAETTDAAVLEYYGAQETSVIALSCRCSRGFHALSGACRLESVPVGDGTRELVVTPLHNPSFVLLRYAPGDLGMVEDDDAPCPCGLRGPRISRLEGRAHVRFAGFDGGSFAPGTLTPLLSRLPVLEHQLIQRTPDRYELRYHARQSMAKDLIRPIVERLRDLSRGPAKLSLSRSSGPLHALGEKPKPFEVAS